MHGPAPPVSICLVYPVLYPVLALDKREQVTGHYLFILLTSLSLFPYIDIDIVLLALTA